MYDFDPKNNWVRDFEHYHRLIQPFQVMRDYLQCNLLQTPSSSFPPLHFIDMQEKYNIVVHLRAGDLVLPYDADFLKNMKLQLEHLLKGFDYHYYFIAESPKSDAANAYPEGFDYLKDVFPLNDSRTTFFNHLDVFSSLYHMMNADMLVMTGSGFPYIAAAASWKPVVIHGPNKVHAGRDWHDAYKITDWAFANLKGIIYHPKPLSLLRAKIVSKYHRYKGTKVP